MTTQIERFRERLKEAEAEGNEVLVEMLEDEIEKLADKPKPGIRRWMRRQSKGETHTEWRARLRREGLW